MRDNPATWAEIEPYFDQVLELQPGEREPWLARLDTTHPSIAQAVRNLLADHAALDAAGFLKSPVLAAPPPGGVVGPYRLIREIGQGGMSSVWLAERSDGQLKREVAVKLPLIGARMHVERFMRERDILAALTHPNIARLYDAGISDSGQPYLAMEYVAGTALIDHCDKNRLTVRERLHVFVQVLEAVQFAHAQLIIHRDLKPSNILVTAEGRVVLLDFGIGKLLTDGVADATHLTHMFGRALTPRYASPEQITGQALGTASDIYSLGVVLYELLTGALPYRPRSETLGALEDAILAEDLRRPSQCDISDETAAARGTSARVLVRALSGDLDTIVLKALKKEPSQRYASISAFAQDIQNNLQSLPVSARPDSAWYRVGRFVSRHKAPASAATVAVLALLGGAGIALWQAQTAAIERDRAVAFASRNEAVTEFLGKVMIEAAESDRPITVNEMLARGEKLALQDSGDSAENRAAVLEMIADRYYNSDDLGHNLELLKNALTLVADSPDQALRSRLTCRYAVSNADLGESGPAIETITRELAQLDADPVTASRCLMDLTRIYLAERRGEDVVRTATRGLERIRNAGRDSSNIEAALLGALAYGHHLNGNNLQAERSFEQAVRRYTELGRERSDGAMTVMNDWAVVAAAAGRPKQALTLYEKVLSIETSRGPDVDPTPTTVGNYARALQAVGRFQQARDAYELECRIARKHPDDTLTIAHCLLGYAQLAQETQAPDEAMKYLEETRELLKSAAPPDSPPWSAYAVVQGRLDLSAGRLAEARAQFDSALKQGNASLMTVTAMIGKAETMLAEGKGNEAATEARRAIEMATSLQGGVEYSNQTGLAWLTLGRALRESRKETEARQALGKAVMHLSNAVDAEHPALLSARRLSEGSPPP